MIKYIKTRLYSLTPEVLLALLCVIQFFFAIAFNLLFDTPNIDTVEMTVIGRELILGYSKHPMLPGWLVHLAFFIFNGDTLGVYVLMGLQAVITYIYIFKLALLIFEGDRLRAIYCAIFFALLPTTNFLNLLTQINHMTLVFPLWAMLCYYFYKATKLKQANNFVISGLLAGLMINSHYASMLLLPSLGFIILMNKEIKRYCLANYKFYLSILVFFITLTPHLLYLTNEYLIRKDFGSFQYGVLAVGKGKYGPLLNLCLYILYIAVSILLPILLLKLLKAKKQFNKIDPHIFIYTVVPFSLMMLVIILGSRIAERWYQPMYITLSILVVSTVAHSFDKRRVVWSLLFIVAVNTVYAAIPKLHYDRTKYPAQYIYETTFAHNKDIKYIDGLMFQGGAISLKAPTHPRVVFGSDIDLLPWIDKSDFYRSKVLYIWENGGEPNTPSPIESGVIEYKKISNYISDQSVLHWQIVDYSQQTE